MSNEKHVKGYLSVGNFRNHIDHVLELVTNMRENTSKITKTCLRRKRILRNVSYESTDFSLNHS